MNTLSDTYRHFNDKVYHYFFTMEAQGTAIILNVDEDFINTTIFELKIDRSRFFKQLSEYLSKDWSLLIYNNTFGPPRYLGLIGLQIYAAYIMDADNSRVFNGYSENAYNPRLCELLEISEPALQALYNNFQVLLWERFANWSRKNGYEISIPPPKKGTGRFSQYPLSQATLNKNDLKVLNTLFAHIGLRKGEYLHFQDFISLIKHADHPPYVTNHYKRVKQRLSDEGKEELFYRLVFDYYNIWDGTADSTREQQETNPSLSNTYRRILTVIFKEETFEICALDDLNNEQDAFALNEQSTLTEICRRYGIEANGILIFSKSEDYEDEWIQQRYLQHDTFILLICEKRSSTNRILNMLTGYCESIPHPTFAIAKLFIPAHAQLSDVIELNYFQKLAVKLTGGLKLNAKTWLAGAGPVILFLAPGSYWLNGQKILEKEVFSGKNLPPGKYVLKHRDFSPKIFFIEHPIGYGTEPIIGGWKVSKVPANWEFSFTDFTVHGANFTTPLSQVKNDVNTRLWIQAWQGRSSQNQLTQLTNIIIRSKYGCNQEFNNGIRCNRTISFQCHRRPH